MSSTRPTTARAAMIPSLSRVSLDSLMAVAVMYARSDTTVRRCTDADGEYISVELGGTPSDPWAPAKSPPPAPRRFEVRVKSVRPGRRVEVRVDAAADPYTVAVADGLAVGLARSWRTRYEDADGVPTYPTALTPGHPIEGNAP